jgi:DNA-binding NarL/FixJ family response regulator
MANRILIVDDHKIMREGLRTLLAQQTALRVVGEACDGVEAIAQAQELQPDLIIMDISMTTMNGIEASIQILHKMPAMKIIALSMHADRRFVLEALKAGVKGYLLKDSAFEELHTAIKTVLQNQVFLSSTITDLVVREFVRPSSEREARSVFCLLSPREREILQLIAEGRSTKEIASQLSISVKTVETHRKQVMDKLKIRSVAELTKYAIREGLTTL